MPNSSPPNSAPTPQSNWPFGVIAVLMAVALWLFVRTGAQVPGPRPIQAPPKQGTQALVQPAGSSYTASQRQTINENGPSVPQ